MGLFGKIGGEFIDIIEWTQPSQSDELAHRFPRYNNEIKYGAKLTVREGQAAVFVNEGRMADVFGPGMYTLETKNLPILSTILGWKYGFSSPFKAEVYFVATRRFTDLKWGTTNPIMLRDPEFGPVRIRAYGTYAVQVSDPAAFLRQLVSTDPSFETFEITGQLRNTIVARFVDAVGAAKIPVLDLAGNYERVAQEALTRIRPELAEMGLALPTFYIENISLPPEVEAALDKRTQMGVLGNLGEYARLQAANSIPDAVRNPGGMAGIGAQVAVGVAMGNQMAGAMNPTSTPGTPPVLPAVTFFVAINGQQSGPHDLPTLQRLMMNGQLTRATLVWRQGMAGWAAAESVAELAGLFPPPLPPGPALPPPLPPGS
jgi:membrane protease subunit (stomatin/prohibitin family)